VILEVNEALCALTGFDREQLVGAGPQYPFWVPDRVDEMLEMRQSLRDQGRVQGEFEIARRDGARRVVAYNAACVPSDEPSLLWIMLLRDVTEERERARGLERRAASDPLTGVLNSRAFRDALRSAVRMASTDRPLTLALLDLDHFKRINDVHGHPVGDEVLVAAVQRLVGATSGLGTFARVGGEEFALLMPDTDAVAGRRIVEQALEALRATDLPEVGRITASAGVAQLEGDMSDDTFYRLADGLLYEAKDLGRDQVR
jgi:diguanylate cyclase (GGDEF)-like protein/PAS domain S-box-containing protein